LREVDFRRNAVNPRVVGSGQYLKIVRPIVELVAVAVVHDFRRQERTAD
jgi:hypothetical protein